MFYMFDLLQVPTLIVSYKLMLHVLADVTATSRLNSDCNSSSGSLLFFPLFFCFWNGYNEKDEKEDTEGLNCETNIQIGPHIDLEQEKIVQEYKPQQIS